MWKVLQVHHTQRELNMNHWTSQQEDLSHLDESSFESNGIAKA